MTLAALGAAALVVCRPGPSRANGRRSWPPTAAGCSCGRNRLLAFRNAVALGADFLELNVHLSDDGALVVIDDPSLDRTTTGVGPVKDRTLAELRGLRLNDRDGRVTAEGIPTLDEVLAVTKLSARRMLLDIKVDGARARYPGVEEKVIAAVEQRGLTEATIVMAFGSSGEFRVIAKIPKYPRHNKVTMFSFALAGWHSSNRRGSRPVSD